MGSGASLQPEAIESGASAQTSANEESAGTTWRPTFGAPLRSFLEAETGGALAIIAAAALALLWANSPWGHSYDSLWSTRLAISIGQHSLGLDLRGWINEGLMTLFFLVVGLEAKRELDLGELRERTRIAVPISAALGGMALAVGIYLALNAGRSSEHAWGTAMSTDTALALGVLALAANGAPARLRVFLLTLLVTDDLVSLFVIGVAYTSHLDVIALVVALMLFASLFPLRYVGRGRAQLATFLAVAVWLALERSGVDPVVCGLAIGLVTSAYPPARDDLDRAVELTRSFREQPTPELAYSAGRGLTSAVSANDRIQYRLHPWTSFVIVPLFALANAGIHIDATLLREALTSPITLGIVIGFVAGKPVGIMAASWIVSRPALAGGRLTVTWPGLAVTGSAAGVGFTVALLIASLALHGAALAQAKLGVLFTVVLSTLMAGTIFGVIRRLPASMRARQLGRTAEQLIDLADEVDPARDHIRGTPDALVTLLEYGDFECPFCGRAEPIIRELLSSHGYELRFVFRHLPLVDVHPRAELAAEASEAASAQGSFWEMHDLLMNDQEHLTPVDLRHHAEALGLDAERFSSELRLHRYAARVNEDVASADASGVSGTPSFFVNGRRLQGAFNIETLTTTVEQAKLRAIAARTLAQESADPEAPRVAR